MGRLVQKYVMECLHSVQSRVARRPLHLIEKPSVPFNTVHVDHLGPFARSVQGNRNKLMWQER